MSVENQNHKEHPNLHNLPDTLPVLRGNRVYAALEYAKPGQEVDIAGGAMQEQIAAEIYKNGLLRLHVVDPTRWTQHYGHLAPTRVVTLETFVPTEGDDEAMAATVPMVRAQTRPAWVGEQHERKLKIGDNNLERVIVFHGEAGEPLPKEAFKTEDFDNDFREIITYLQNPDTQAAIDHALKEHRQPSRRGMLGKLASRFAKS